MERKTKITFIVFFLVVIFSLPVIQAVIEIRQGRSIQVLDLVIDTFVTPFKNANIKHALALKIQSEGTALLAEVSNAASKAVAAPASDAADQPSVGWDAQKAEELADEVLVNISELKKTAMTINRHVQDDPKRPYYVEIDSLSAIYNALMLSLRNGDDIKTVVQQVKSSEALIAAVVKDNPQPKLTDAPLLIAKNLRIIYWDAKYLRPFEKEMENSSIFANNIRPAMMYSRYVMFGDLGDKAVAGTGGWFFYKPDVEYLVRPYILDPRSMIVDPNDKPIVDDPIKAILTFKKQLEGFGIDLVVMIVPGKPSIYPEMLNPSFDKSKVGKFSHSVEIIKQLKASNVEVVDLFDAFTQERAQDAASGDSLYLHKDTHWRSRGVVIAARTVAQKIKQYPWYTAGNTPYLIDTLMIDRVGDVGAMTTLPAQKVGDLSLSFAPEKTACYQVYAMAQDNTNEKILYKDDYKNSQILVLGDSFSRIFQTDEPRAAGWISHLAYELNQPVASIVNDGGASTLVRESLARRANLLKGKKLVVWEIVERDFRFGAEGWKDVDIKM